jgi:hypothetical protein
MPLSDSQLKKLKLHIEYGIKDKESISARKIFVDSKPFLPEWTFSDFYKELMGLFKSGEISGYKMGKSWSITKSDPSVVDSLSEDQIDLIQNLVLELLAERGSASKAELYEFIKDRIPGLYLSVFARDFKTHLDSGRICGIGAERGLGVYIIGKRPKANTDKPVFKATDDKSDKPYLSIKTPSKSASETSNFIVINKKRYHVLINNTRLIGMLNLLDARENVSGVVEYNGVKYDCDFNILEKMLTNFYGAIVS